MTAHERAGDRRLEVDAPSPGEPCAGDARGLSVLIVSWNTRALTLEALRSFLPLPARLDAEVIVIDNASTDGSADAIAEAFPDVQLIRNDTNRGFAAGVNVGLRLVRKPFVLLLNPDTRVRDGAIEKLVDYAAAHPQASIVGPRVLNEDETRQDSRFRFPTLLTHALAASYLYQLFAGSSFFNQERFAGRDVEHPVRTNAVSGCCFLIRRDLLDEIGLLDEGYFMYGEEMDLCFRAWRAGFEVHYVPAGEVVHLGGASSRLAARRNFLEFRRSLLRFHRKHHGRAYAEAARGLLCLFLLLRLPYWGLRALTSSANRQASRAQLGNYIAGLGLLMQPLSAILRDGPAARETVAGASS